MPQIFLASCKLKLAKPVPPYEPLHISTCVFFFDACMTCFVNLSLPNSNICQLVLNKWLVKQNWLSIRYLPTVNCWIFKRTPKWIRSTGAASTPAGQILVKHYCSLLVAWYDRNRFLSYLQTSLSLSRCIERLCVDMRANSDNTCTVINECPARTCMTHRLWRTQEQGKRLPREWQMNETCRQMIAAEGDPSGGGRGETEVVQTWMASKK